MGDPLIQAAAERGRLAEEFTEAAEQAFSRCGIVERQYLLHGRRFALRCGGGALAGLMSRALAHLACPVVQDVDLALTIDCWESELTGVPAPQPRWPAHLFTNRGEILGLDGPGMRIAFFKWMELWCAYFPTARRAFYCLPAAASFPRQQLGSPALAIFNWWLGGLGWQFTHAAVAGTEKGAVLIAGQSGAGKSTLAFSTWQGPLSYLSDDYCVLAPGEPLVALALYNSGKLDDASLDLLPALRAHASLPPAAGEKAIFFWPEQFPGRLLPEAPVRAVVLSQLDPDETSLVPCPPTEARATIAASTLSQLAGAGPQEMMRLGRLLHSLPAFRLKHGRDFAATHRLLRDLCAS